MLLTIKHGLQETPPYPAILFPLTFLPYGRRPFIKSPVSKYTHGNLEFDNQPKRRTIVAYKGTISIHNIHLSDGFSAHDGLDVLQAQVQEEQEGGKPLRSGAVGART